MSVAHFVKSNRGKKNDKSLDDKWILGPILRNPLENKKIDTIWNTGSTREEDT